MKYIVSDTAINGDLTQHTLKKFFPQHQSLFKGTPHEKLDNVAPYLFLANENPENTLKQQPGTKLLHHIFIETSLALDALTAYFQKHIYVSKEDKKYFFRCWDARVLERFLPECNTLQLKEFFGPIQKFVCMHEDKKLASEFTFANNRLQVRSFPAAEFFDSSSEK